MAPSWQTVWRTAGTEGTKAETQSVTEYDSANHKRTVTVTAPDQTQTVTVYQDGLLQSVTRRDNTANHNTVFSTTYGYNDNHKRQTAITDSRNGTTTYAYNDADQVLSVTTPLPGGSGELLRPFF